MINKAVVVLGIGALVTGLAPLAQAQSTAPSTNTGAVTVSGSSLQAVEGRSIADFNSSLSGTGQAGQSNSGTSVGRLTRKPEKSPLADIIKNDNVDFVFGDTLNQQNENSPLTFPNRGDAGDGGVRLQYQLGR